MATVTLPYTITNGQTTDATKLMGDLNAIVTEVNGNLESVNIKDLAVITAKLDALAVTAAKLAADAVETLKIKDANVTTGKLATDAVETLKIKDANVTAIKLATDAVETSKIKNDAVNDLKIDWGTGADQVSAVDLPIADAGGIITATETEGALQEIQVNVNTHKARTDNPHSVTASQAAAIANSLLTADGDIIIRSGGVPARLGKRSAVLVSRGTSLQTITTGTWTKVQFNAEEYDENSEFDITTNYRFTATVTGVYVISASLSWSNAVDVTPMSVAIYKNGTMKAYSSIIASGTGSQSTDVIAAIKLDATNYIEIWTIQASGSDKSIMFSSGATWLTIAQLV